MEQKKLKIVNSDNKQCEYDILCTFDSKITGKSYMIYTDYSKDSAGNIQVFSATYIPNEEPIKLEALKSNEEHDIIEEVLKELEKELKLKLKK